MSEHRIGGTMGDNIYGAQPASHVTKCVHSRNPYGHNPECVCGWANIDRPSQVVPYLERDISDELPVSDHEHWWPADIDQDVDRMREERAFND
ncbi:hypothetical protein ACFSWE_16575 [Leucobacter albus]|uniref:Uncharacterized protein n=1 Tax=Leucobacter albus TaxID=272210 RepID=A0ABW3TVI5_9MICO